MRRCVEGRHNSTAYVGDHDSSEVRDANVATNAIHNLQESHKKCCAVLRVVRNVPGHGVHDTLLLQR